MARHVFQYERMDTHQGLCVSDPTMLPPLPPLPGDIESGARVGGMHVVPENFVRPERADAAGLRWVNNQNTPPPGVRLNTGIYNIHRRISVRCGALFTKKEVKGCAYCDY